MPAAGGIARRPLPFRWGSTRSKKRTRSPESHAVAEAHRVSVPGRRSEDDHSYRRARNQRDSGCGSGFAAGATSSDPQITPLANSHDGTAAFGLGGGTSGGAPALLPTGHLSDASAEVQKLTDSAQITQTREAREATPFEIAGEEVVAPSVDAPPKVVNLMEALKKSLDAVSTAKKRPAKASVPKATAVAKRKRA